MTPTTSLAFRRRPSTAAFMLKAFYPSRLRPKGAFPPIRAAWSPVRPPAEHLAAFTRLTGLQSNGSLPILFPQVMSFPLLMTIVTHPRFPLPIWRMLQVRNQMLQTGPIPAIASLNLETRVFAQRVLEKGVEVDLHTTLRLRSGDRLEWESLTTFYYRGSFGQAGPPSPAAQAPEAGGDEAGRWRTEKGGGRVFGSLTGDYNGIHWWDAYARLQGFRKAFLHPHRTVGQCLSRIGLPAADGPQRLDTWFKAPVYYGEEVRLCARPAGEGTVFALHEEREARPAIVGCWRPADPGERLVKDDAAHRASLPAGLIGARRP